jgi:dipeptidyl aminopeptidase/acylaminoacyl peptidase
MNRFQTFGSWRIAGRAPVVVIAAVLSLMAASGLLLAGHLAAGATGATSTKSVAARSLGTHIDSSSILPQVVSAPASAAPPGLSWTSTTSGSSGPAIQMMQVSSAGTPQPLSPPTSSAPTTTSAASSPSTAGSTADPSLTMEAVFDQSQNEMAYISASSGEAGKASSEGQVMLTGANGTSAHAISDAPMGRRPALSSDGTQLAYIGNGGVVIVGTNGSNLKTFTNPFDPNSVSWFPDDTQVAVSAGPGPSMIYILNVMTGAVKQLTAAGSDAYDPAVSPDGTKIAFGQVGANSIFVDTLSSGTVSQVTSCVYDSTGCIQDLNPTWSPNGAMLAFTRNFITQRDGVGSAQQIFVANADGSDLQQVTSGPADNVFPAW